MALTSLIALIDDIATVLDDVAALTKVAGKKTAGVLGDDLALNAQQVAGVNADRELPVVWAVAKGSLRNKAMLVPGAMAISALAHQLIVPVLMVGGAYLCFEGAEKLWHALMHRKAHDAPEPAPLADCGPAAVAASDAADREKAKIAGAIRTDLVLSAEIIAITLGTVAEATFSVQIAVLVGVSLVMTAGVYGLVAGIVKLDDAGLYLLQRPQPGARGNLLRWIGRLLLRAAPWLMHSLSVAGTAAMFLVGGGILMHGIPGGEAWIERVAAAAGGVGVALPWLLHGVLGVGCGAVLVAATAALRRVRNSP
ncbi:MAG: DUF808 domain-containing protein [Deltaproteobacteria bacterium]|nr:DUF808 domain-containing protein [Deltaproteobacteria bacterium]